MGSHRACPDQFDGFGLALNSLFEKVYIVQDYDSGRIDFGPSSIFSVRKEWPIELFGSIADRLEVLFVCKQNAWGDYI